MARIEVLQNIFTKTVIFVIALLGSFYYLTAQNNEADVVLELGQQKIADITITGNRNVPIEAIKAKIPYRVGQVFKPYLTSELIRSLYGMGYFKPTIQVVIEEASPTEVIIHITLEEKDLVDEVIFEGNLNLKREEIDKEIHISELRAVDQEDLARISMAIQAQYAAKDYHDALVKAELVPLTPGRTKVRFIIEEGPRSYVREVRFVGNISIPSKELRKLILTRPQWLFGFIDKSGTYHPEALEHDRYVVEHYYKSCGFLRARVDDVIVERDAASPTHFIVTFFIAEGDQYYVNSITAPGNELLSETELLARIAIRPGDLYSSENIRQTIELLRLIWGEYGYIFADINFDLKVNEEDKTVDLIFNSVLGSAVSCNRITVTGNRKTREEVIRRELTVNEGVLLTTRGMDESRENVERLGYFDPKAGVNWKITRLNESQADLELMVKEILTGRLFADLKIGGDGADFQSPARAVQIGFGASDINFRGTGIKYTASAYFSLQDRQLALNVMDPWFLDRPLQAGFDIFHRTSTYTDFRHVQESPREQITGGSVNFGFIPPWLSGANCLFDVGAESIRYKQRVIGRPPSSDQVPAFGEGFQKLIDRIFQPGELIWTGAQIVQDQRNNAVRPSRGYLWSSSLKVGIPHQQGGFGFVKWDADAHWYTPIINEYDLILHLHGHLGLVNEIGNFTIPYRELYHIGGPATVRGFTFGQIGPTLFGDSLGAKKAFWMNAELIFPITRDIVGLVFYDGGAGWDTPDAAEINAIKRGILRNNQFNFRQAIGFGIKMRYPTPISIAVGFKLDHNKRSRENVSEVHFTTAVDF